MSEFASLAINDADELTFGNAPRPINLPNGLVIGGGKVHPEINFTLPVMSIEAGTMSEVRRQYSEMIEGVCRRACELQLPGLVAEFELLPPLTQEPVWGAEVTSLLKEALLELENRSGIPTALRVTPNDIREFERPPRLRDGTYVERMFESFAACARAGADFLALESTGGKEVHDDAIVNGDLPLSVFALGILACTDMASLWDRIVAVAREHGALPSGDSACGFANTAMVLAEQRHIPRVWAAAIRVISIPRSLVAFERGAVGPGKDCAYEGVYLKAITGCPMALEGAEAACAHLSPIGNIAKATPDLWSNESVQNVKLLGGMAPTVSLEQLAYATRLMNVALRKGPDAARSLRDWYVESDAYLDPQAYILRPEVAVWLAREVISETTPYLRTRRAAQAGLACLRDAHARGLLTLSTVELNWLERLSHQADSLPEDEGEFIAGVVASLEPGKVLLGEYGIAR
jgi:methanol--5-hydroxybenzimidazolylcobamide Co-methyltransferase